MIFGTDLSPTTNKSIKKYGNANSYATNTVSN